MHINPRFKFNLQNFLSQLDCRTVYLFSNGFVAIKRLRLNRRTEIPWDRKKFNLLSRRRKLHGSGEFDFLESSKHKTVAKRKFVGKRIFPSYILFQELVRSVSRFPSGRIKRAGKRYVEQFKPSLVNRRKQMEAAKGRGNSGKVECTFVYQTCLQFGYIQSSFGLL